MLVLLNNGAKWIDFENITVENFNLKDSQNKDIKLYLLSSVRGMGYGESEVIQPAGRYYRRTTRVRFAQSQLRSLLPQPMKGLHEPSDI